MSIMLGPRLLRLCGDLNRELYTLLERSACALINRFDSLDIDVGDDEGVGREFEAVANLATLILTEDGAEARGDGFACITSEVSHVEDLRGVLLTRWHRK